eukprot:2756251-Pyramimonas_sp.AAC.1
MRTSPFDPPVEFPMMSRSAVFGGATRAIGGGTPYEHTERSTGCKKRMPTSPLGLRWDSP